MMRKVWNIIVAACCFSNAVKGAFDWYHGIPADWFIWASAIVLSLVIGFDCLEELFGWKAE